jgi:outer membrane protein OmpA-like peptidoglycan-associated protein
LATSTITSGGKYLLVSNITNDAVGPSHNPAPTVLNYIGANNPSIGSRDFTLTGSVLRPATTLTAWEFTITSSGTTDSGNPGYWIRTGASYLNMMQGESGVYDSMTPIMIGTTQVSYITYPSDPFTCLSPTPRVWYWDGTDFYTKYTSNTTTVGGYHVDPNNAWSGYYTSGAPGNGWAWLQWSATPWGAGGNLPDGGTQYGADYTNAIFRLKGMRPGFGKMWPPQFDSSISPAGQVIKEYQLRFGGTWAVAPSAYRYTDQVPGPYTFYDSGLEVKNISLYASFVDTTPPAISGVPADKDVEATGPSGAVVSWTAPTANDLVDGAITPVCSPASGSTFPLGETIVTVSATDTAGNHSSKTFEVNVSDTTAPVISGVPADKIVEATGPSGAVVSWTAPTATDLVDGSITPVCSPASGSTFALGETTVTVTATDAAGNHSSKTFKVTVSDTTAPVISGVPADKIVEATGPSGAVVSWTAPTANDLVDGAITPVCSPASGSTFALGETIVTVAATDTAGNHSSKSFKVTVSDTTGPSISGVPADQVVEATGPTGAVVSWTAPTATDEVDGAIACACTPASGSTFPLGETIVTVAATDTAGNHSSKTFKVTVSDTTGPSISGVPADQVVEATGPSGAVVSWTAPTATDEVDGAVACACTPASGSTFPLGETIVTVSATDTAGNHSSKTFKVTVSHTAPPQISGVPADKMVEATGPTGAMVSWTAPTATDLVDGSIIPSCSPCSGSFFPIGQTMVTVTATDTAGNPAHQRFKVTVSARKIAKLCTVRFAFDSPKLDSNAKRVLRSYARTIAARGYTSVSLRGFTSSQRDGGNWASRKKLSLNRAKNVKAYLASQLKALHVSPTISVVGYASANPVASNKTSAGRAKNRRVELWAK